MDIKDIIYRVLGRYIDRMSLILMIIAALLHIEGKVRSIALIFDYPSYKYPP